MASDAKSALLLALTPKGGMPKGDSPDKGGDDVEMTAAGDILEAIKDNDQHALHTALHTFVMKCMTDDENSDEAPEAPESEG